MDSKYVKEYELTYEEQDVQDFLDGLEKTVILPEKANDDVIRLHAVIEQAKQYDKYNTLLTYEDIKQYIRELHTSTDLNLTKLYILMKSTSDMRNGKVMELFRNFFNLYSYRELATYDRYHVNEIVRKMYELRLETPNMDSDVIKVNTVALQDIGFSIEGKIKAKQKVIK